MAEKQKSIRTPLARAKGLGSARDGTMHWWAARVTSVALVPLCLYLLFYAPSFLPEDRADVLALVSAPVMSLALLLTIIVGFYHAALGVQVIVEDYVHHEGWKLSCLIASKIFFFATGAAAIYALLLIDFGKTG